MPMAGPWDRFRFGPGPESYAAHATYPGMQFPVDAYDNFLRQNVPRWTSTDAPTIAAYTALVDRVCPCGSSSTRKRASSATRSRRRGPEKVKALVAVEPSGVGDPQQPARLAGVPVLVLYGDFVEP